jgi:hypothetical protein
MIERFLRTRLQRVAVDGGEPGYLREPPGEVTASNWPCAWDEEFAAPMRAVLERILTACIGFASEAKA